MAKKKDDGPKARGTQPRIYVSCPVSSNMNERRRDLREALLGRIRNVGFAPQEFGVSGLPAETDENWTFEGARRLMTRCDGAVILGLARSFESMIDWVAFQGQLGPLPANQQGAVIEMVVSGSEDIAAREARVTRDDFADWMKPGTSFRVALDSIRADVEQQAKEGANLIRPISTEYIHFEGGLAVAEGLPTLILAEQGMGRRGVLYEGSGHTIVEIPDRATRKWLGGKKFQQSFQAFRGKVEKRSDVFLGYCSKDSKAAAMVRRHLERSGYTVHDWARDFKKGGATILEEIHRAAGMCRTAVFLFAKNDPLKGKATAMALPRDNVLLEAGYFIQAKGKERVAIIREEGAKMPADLGGVIYQSYKVASSKGKDGLTPVLNKVTRFVDDAI